MKPFSRTLLFSCTILTLFSAGYCFDAGWVGLQTHEGHRISRPHSDVSLNVPNAGACVRLCWLYTACSILSFNNNQLTCDLYLSEESVASETEMDAESLVVDMKDAGVDITKITPRGCDKRPCSATQLCAPVRKEAIYVCIDLVQLLCPAPPPKVVNSHVYADSISTVLYECESGYARIGTTFVSRCDRTTATWSDVDVSCVQVDCGKPPPIFGMAVDLSGTSTTAGSVISYTCLAGAAPNSSEMTSTCQGSSGQWSPVMSECSAVLCDDPPVLDFMNFTVGERSPDGIFPGLTKEELKTAYGAEVLYTCLEGYAPSLDTSLVSRCQADGSWSSTDNFLCSVVDCGTPPALGNSSSIKYSSTTYGSIATVTCLPGFSPIGGFNLTCDAIGNWKATGHKVLCELIDCGEPPTLDDAVAEYNPLLVGSKISTPYQSQSTYQSRLEISCQPPFFQSVQDPSIVCGADSQWSPQNVTQMCSPCDQRHDAAGILNGTLTVTLSDENLFGDTASFTCNGNFFQFGNISDHIHCASEDGIPNWQGLSDIVCLQHRWQDPMKSADGIYRFPVYTKAIRTGFKACAVTTLTSINGFVMKLSEDPEVTGDGISPARMSYRKSGSDYSLTFGHHTIGYKTNIVYSVILNKKILEIDESANLCIELDLTKMKYKFLKDDDVVMEMDVVRYLDVVQLRIQRSARVTEANIHYS